MELFHTLHMEQVGLAVMLKTSIREVIGSYLDKDTGYTHWIFFVVFLYPSRSTIEPQLDQDGFLQFFLIH
jgi:hypothetical protein